MEKTVELLHEISKRLAQTIDMIDILSLACSSVEKADLIGPLEIMKRDLQDLYFQIDEVLYEDNQ